MSHPDFSRVNVGGRDTPHPSGPSVAHEMRYAPGLDYDDDGTARPVILASCACRGYALTMRESYYTRAQLDKLADAHEGRTP